MATINNATRLGVPGLADTGDIEQDSLAIGTGTANRLTNRYTDLDAGGLILNNSLTTQSIQYWMNTVSYTHLTLPTILLV